MKKIFLILVMFITSTFAFEVKELKSINELSKDKNILLMFSTSFCPWCARQTSVLEEISLEKPDIQFVKVLDTSDVYKELLTKYPFTVKYFPTLYLLSYENEEIFIKYEFEGYQRKTNLIKVLNSDINF